MDVLFLLIAISCVLLALVSAFSTLGLSPTAEKIADKVIYGSCAAALMSVLLAALFLWAYEPLRVDQRTIAHSVDPHSHGGRQRCARTPTQRATASGALSMIDA